MNKKAVVDNLNSAQPRFVPSNKKTARQKIATDSGMGGINFTIPQPYQPEYGNLSKVFWPIDRLQANRYARLYYKTDAVIGTIVDMYAEIIASEFYLAGESVEGTVKDVFELCVEKTQAIAKFSAMIKSYLVLGEVIPHLFFDKDKKIWTKLILHNPDQITVTESDFLNIAPIVELMPDENLQNLTKSKHPHIQQAMAKLPAEVLAVLMSGQGMPLDTELNATFIARKLFDNDTRGTSIISRVYDILMYQDSVMNASLMTARRHAGPLKIAKLGMPLPDGTPWVPDADFEKKLVGMLAAAESDPLAFLLIPYFVNFEAFGTTDRMMSLRNEWDMIEKIKLVALGVSSEFIHGTSTFASMRSSLQVLMMRMANMRNFFEHTWWLPKFFRPIAEMNEFVRPTKAEVDHNVRFRRSRREVLEDNRYIIPQMKWARHLDTKVESDLLDVYEQLSSRLNIPISKATAYAAAGLDKETELENLKQEADEAIKLPKKKPSGGGGASEITEEIPEAVPVEEVPAEEGTEIPGASKQSFTKVAAYQEDLESFVDFVETKKPSKYWARILKKNEKPEEFIKKMDLQRVSEFLEDTGYNNKEIEGFKTDLLKEVPMEIKTDVADSLLAALGANPTDEDLGKVTQLLIKNGNKRLDLGMDLLTGAGNKI